ncbi:hypothetical protein EDB19DRAFT_1321238 [Suillus lakei]|nr:hypothetical protein EDB19DRAFT_1321238 [Suillus lakei]
MDITESYAIPDLERALTEEESLPDVLRDIMTSLFMRLLCFLALWRSDLQDHWTSLQSDEAFESVRTMICSILGNTITIASCLTPCELKPTLTYSPKGGHPHRFKRWFLQGYSLPCSIFRLYVTCSLYSALYVPHARHDHDVDIRLEHVKLAPHRPALDSKTTQTRRLRRRILPIINRRALVLRRLVPELFHLGDVDSRVLLPKHGFPCCDCVLAGYLRRYRWDDIGRICVELCDEPRVALDIAGGTRR